MTTTRPPKTPRPALPAGTRFPSFAALVREWKRLRAEARDQLAALYRYRPAVRSYYSTRHVEATGYKFIRPRASCLFALGAAAECIIYPADGHEWNGTRDDLLRFLDFAVERGAVSVGVEQGFDGCNSFRDPDDYDPWIHTVSLTLWEAPDASTPTNA